MSQAKKLAAGVPMADSNGKVTTISVGDKNGQLVKWYDFPTRSNLIDSGYMPDSMNTRDYLLALLRWMADNLGGKEAQFIGRANPNTRGIMHLHVYEGAKTADGYPTYSSGALFVLGGEMYTFGTSQGKPYVKKTATEDV